MSSLHSKVQLAAPAGVTRRGFCRVCGAGAALAAAGEATLGLPVADAAASKLSWVEAKHYRKEEYDRVTCQICPRKCRVDDRERGYCATRENRSGKYYSLVYNRVVALNVDPIEKKPFFHFLPGATALSLSTAGCCLECQFCQNYEISQFRPEQVDSQWLTPQHVTQTAKERRAPIIAFTYGEPVVYFEYAYDCAVVARKAGLKPVAITSGYIAQAPLKEWLQVMSAIKVDLKAFTDDYYREVCAGELKPVLEALVAIKRAGVWLELVYLVVPTLNDRPEDITRMSRWIKQNLGAEVPLHFSRFFPTYKLKNLPATPVPTLERCVAAAEAEGLRYVYLGNVPGHEKENTRCAHCGKRVVERTGYRLGRVDVRNGKCAHCSTTLPGVWQ